MYQEVKAVQEIRNVVKLLADADNVDLARTVLEFLVMSEDLTSEQSDKIFNEFDLDAI